MTVAGCELTSSIFSRWQQHFAPAAQPFFASESLSRKLPAWPRFTREEFARSGVSLSLHDTFTTYSVSKEAVWVVWLTQGAFSSLSPTVQAALLAKQRDFGRGGVFSADKAVGVLEAETLTTPNLNGLFVWWPELWVRLSDGEKYAVLKAFAETDRLPCRRHDLEPDDWERIARVLPGARELAGTFLPDSGGNCLATIMTAFGVPAVAELWIHPEPFERWLEAFSPLSDIVVEPVLGNVLVWRDGDRVQHAAVSLGKGYVLHKEAQGWFAPRQVMRLGDVLERWQDDGSVTSYRPATPNSSG